MILDFSKKENKKKVSNFWHGKKESKPPKTVVADKPAYQSSKFLNIGTRYEGEGKERISQIKSLFGFLEKKKKPALTQKEVDEENPMIREDKKREPSISKEQLEEFLGSSYQNRQGSLEVIRVENIFKDFILGENVVNILKDVSFTVNQGEFVMLVGPSGCGKSTLLHSIYGLEEPSSGKIWIDNLDIWNESKNWRADFRNRHIGFIPQQSFWIKSFSVLENIAIPATINGENFSSALERAAKLIQLIQMDHRSDNRPYDLSGGEQQRVAMARALLLNPKFIIADEPTGNLDHKSGEELMDLFKEFNKRFNITILMVTHNPEQYKYCTKLVQMVDGRIVGQKKSRKK
jgi:ABC-type lipoprotein export system ATPase subunit